MAHALSYFIERVDKLSAISQHQSYKIICRSLHQHFFHHYKLNYRKVDLQLCKYFYFGLHFIHKLTLSDLTLTPKLIFYYLSLAPTVYPFQVVQATSVYLKIVSYAAHSVNPINIRCQSCKNNWTLTSRWIYRTSNSNLHPGVFILNYECSTHIAKTCSLCSVGSCTYRSGLYEMSVETLRTFLIRQCCLSSEHQLI